MANDRLHFPVIAGFLLGTVCTGLALLVLQANERKEQEKNKEKEKPHLRRGQNSSFNVSHAIISTDEENVNLISDLLRRLWPHIKVASSTMIRDTVEPMFQEMMPQALRSLHFTELNLGDVPIVLDNVVVHELKDDKLQFEMDVIWNSDSNIKLSANYGLNFGVKSIKMNGRMKFVLKPLTNQVPIVAAIQYAFVNTPMLDLSFTGLAQVADLSVVEKTIRKIIQQKLAGQMVLPNRKLYKMDNSCDFREIYQPPKKVARITCVEGRGFVQQKELLSIDIPDIYCKIKLGHERVWKTSVVKNSVSPVWNESNDFLLSDEDQIVSLEAWDEDKAVLDTDDLLGSAQVTISELLLEGKTMELELMENKKYSGAFITLSCDLYDFTQKTIGSLEKSASNDSDHICGLITIVISRVLDIPLPREDAASFVKITCNGHTFSTVVVADAPGYDALNPIYDAGFYIPLFASPDPNGEVQLMLMNGQDTVLGMTQISFHALREASGHCISETRPLQEEGQGPFLEFAVGLWGIQEQNGTPTPITLESKNKTREGVDDDKASKTRPTPTPTRDRVRVSILKGGGFPVKTNPLPFVPPQYPHVYCNIKFGSSPKIWRTPTIENSSEPCWHDVSNNFTLLNLNQVIHIDVMNGRERKKEISFGSARTTVGKVMLQGGKIELNLNKDGQPTGAFLEISCARLME